MRTKALKSNNNIYVLRFSINAQCEAEDILGKPLSSLNESAGFSTLRTLLFVGLKHGGQPVTLEKAGDIMGEVIEDKGMDYFTETISQAIQQSLSQSQNNQHVRDVGK